MDSRLLDVSEVITSYLDNVQEVMWPFQGSDLGLECRFYCQNQQNFHSTMLLLLFSLQFFSLCFVSLTFSIHHPLHMSFLFSALKSPLSILYSLDIEGFHWFYIAPSNLTNITSVEDQNQGEQIESHSSVPAYQHLNRDSDKDSHNGRDKSKDTLLIQ